MFEFFKKNVVRKIALILGAVCLTLALTSLVYLNFNLKESIIEHVDQNKEFPYSTLENKLNKHIGLQVGIAVSWVILVTLTSLFIARMFLGKSLRKLSMAVESAKGGDFTTRVKVHTPGEIGRLAGHLNQLFSSLMEMQASKMDTALELDSAQRELKLKTQLEEKNRIIEKTNLTLTRRLRDLALLYDLNRGLISSLQLDQVLNVITDKIGDALGFNALGFSELVVFLISEEQRKLKLVNALGKQIHPEFLGKLVEPLHGHLAHAMRSRNPVLVKNISSEVMENTYENLLPSSGSLLSVPVHTQDHLLGVLCFIRAEKDAFSEDEIQLLTSVTQLAAMAILNAQLYKEKLDLSITDELTQLANRRQMQSRLEMEWNRAKRLNSALSLLMVDIDRFKRYNDINGHLLGDEVLKSVARILEENTRSVDTVARFGGEEFVIILPGQGKKSAVSVSEKLRRSVSTAQFQRANRQPGGHLTISAGVASYPEDADHPKALLDRSDLALYIAKSTGRDCTVIYEKGMEKIEGERRLAMAENKRRHRGRRRSKSRFQLNLLEQ